MTLTLSILVKRMKKNQLSNLNKKLSMVEIEIKSFSSIHIDKGWLNNLKILINLCNLKYLQGKLIKFKKKLNELILMLQYILTYKHRYHTNVVLWLYNKFFIQYNCILQEIHYLILVKPYLLSNTKMIRFPTKKIKINTLKSPHVFKKAQDHYELQNHKVLVKLPLLITNNDFVYNIIKKTSKLNSLYRMTFIRKNLYFIQNIENNENR